jgi:hypothetical protein
MGWIVSLFAVFLAAAGVQITTCTQGSEDAWLASIILYTPISAALLGYILFAKRHHTDWIVLSIPLTAVLAYCSHFVSGFFVENTIEGHHLCSVLKREPGFDAYESTPWLRVWAPLELALLGAYGWAVGMMWRSRLRRGDAAPGSLDAPAEPTAAELARDRGDAS